MGKCKQCKFLFPVPRDAGDYLGGRPPARGCDGAEHRLAHRVRHQGESSS